jgi:hypothetical protein
MTMKRTDLEKMKERKITAQVEGPAVPDRFGPKVDKEAKKPRGLMGALLNKVSDTSKK